MHKNKKGKKKRTPVRRRGRRKEKGEKVERNKKKTNLKMEKII